MLTAMAQHWPRAVVLHLLLQIHFTVALFSLHSSSDGAFTGNNTTAVPVPCLPDQASALLRLKRSFTTTNYSIIAFRSWRVGTDCCRWVGIQCSDFDGRVTSLDLGERWLESGGLEPVLFDLVSLKYLNLAYNNFNRSQLPSSGFERLVNLTHLNLSTSSFSGQVPAAINSLTNLVSLDLSTDFGIVELLGLGFMVLKDESSNEGLVEQNLETLVANMSNLRELHLGFVNLSNSGTRWCSALAISCPKLQVISLPKSGLFGPICSSLSSLHSISVINLELNYLSGPFPNFFINLANLIVLQLRRNNLQGWVSPAIFQHKKLATIDLYHNLDLSGHLPSFSVGSRLQKLNVGRTNFSGIIPTSVSNLKYLKKLCLGASGFRGELPSSIGNLKSLSTLEISGMGLVGSIPSWVANLTSLKILKFYDCGLSGSIPSFIGNFEYLEILFLCNCRFSGEIASHVSNLTQLEVLLLYSNKFMGTLDITFSRKLPNLIALDLSHNNLVVLDGEDNSSLASSLPKLQYLSLSGCKMSKFPNFLRHQDEIFWLDLSYNQIKGAIPRWAWELWNGIQLLDLSSNQFTSVGHDPYLPIQDIGILDLSNNMFEGPIPIPQGSAAILSYSNNMFSSISSHLSAHISDVILFLASRNNLSGDLESSFCGMNILLLDLSYNNFTGSIPSCLMDNVNGMQSLNLRKNQLRGEIPNNNKEGCSFVALDFSSNQIEGKLPRSLVACKNLEILDVGNNLISDPFPCWMSELLILEVIVLKSNKFFGQVAHPIKEKNDCAFPSATIVDLSSNNFHGPLPEDLWFKNLRSMIFKDPNMSFVIGHKLPGLVEMYKYTTAITYKGHDTTFAQIITTLVFIDFSSNKFNGSIPKAIGELGLLHGLNISHNFLTGPIPSQLGHLSEEVFFGAPYHHMVV